MRYLDEQTQSELLNMNEVIEEVGQALKAFSEGNTETTLIHVITQCLIPIT